MNVLDAVASQCVRTLWAVSVQVSVLVGLVAVVSMFSRRSSPRLRHWLWCIVLVRLCLPINLTLPLGLAGHLREAVEGSFMSSSEGRYLPSKRLESVLGTEYVDTAQPIQLHPEAGSVSMKESVAVRDVFRPVSLAGKIGLAWFIIAICLAGTVGLRTIRARRFILSCPVSARADLVALIERLRARLRIKRQVTVRLLAWSRETGGPIVTGVLRPTVLLPVRMVGEWDLKDLEPVLLHELAHIRRFDLLVNWVQTAIQVIYFFHPLVWYANWRLRQEREMICDDMAVVHMGAGRKRYSKSVLRVIQDTKRVPSFAAAGLGLAESHSSLARRIARIMSRRYRVHRRMRVTSFALLAILACVSVVLASDEGERTSSDPAGAAEHAEQDLAVRVGVHLTDGSRLIGEPKAESVSLRHALGEMDVPIRDISTITRTEDRQVWSVELQDGDRLTGNLNLRQLEMTALFGEVVIPIRDVERIDGPRAVTVRGGVVSSVAALRYPFDGSGPSVQDKSGSGKHGKLQGAERRDGKIGTGLFFDGIDDCVTVPDVHLANFTFSAWVATAAVSVNNRRVILLDDGQHYYSLEGNIGGGATLYVDRQIEMNDYGRRFPVGTWTHLAATYDGETARLYVNGEVAMTRKGAFPDGIQGTLYIGGIGTHNGGFWHGGIDEVAIFDRALSEKQVKELYGVPGPAEPNVLEYPVLLDERTIRLRDNHSLIQRD